MPTRRLAIAGLLASGLIPKPGHAQTWPARPITLTHGFGAGGNADSISRVVAAALSSELGQQVIVEAKPGAGGNLASELLTKASPDGYSLILLTGGHAVSAALYKNLRFKPIDDFAFLSLVGTFPFVIATSNDSPIKSIPDLIAAAKKAPDKVTFSSVGFGSTQHLTGELFAASAGIKLTHVAYRGGMQPLTDVMSGRVDILVDSITVAGGAINAGTIRGLGVTSKNPWPTIPQVQPIASTVPDFEVRSWVGIAAPAATPRDVVAKLNAALRKVVRSPEIAKQLDTLGVQPDPSSPEAMRDFVAAEAARWNRVIDQAKIERI